uniref:Replication factor A C-terminal domain-containing protein n=1 Tax=Chenopodium quinoa TaxID=63459 RepID=A0A803MLN7_CHEQI
MVRRRNLGKAPVVGEGEEADRPQVVSSGPRRRQPLGQMPPLSHATTLSDMEEREPTTNVPISAVPLASARPFSSVTFREWEEPTLSASDAIHGPRCLPEVLHETNCGLSYERLGIYVKRKVIRRDPAITPTSERAPALRANYLEIVKEILATAAAIEAGVSESTPDTEDEDSSEDELLDNLPLNLLLRKKETRVAAQPKKPSLDTSSSDQEVEDMGRKRKSMAVFNPAQFPLEYDTPSSKRTKANDGPEETSKERDSEPLTSAKQIENIQQETLSGAMVARDQMIKDLDDKNSLFKKEAEKKQTELETEIKRLKDLVSSTEFSLTEVRGQISLIKEQNQLKQSEFESKIDRLKDTISFNNLRLIEVQNQLQTEKDGVAANNKMRVTLFGDQIKAYDEAIAYNGEYKISNATVKPIDDQYRTTHDQLPYQLHFNHRTVVQPICTETGYVVPQYQSIASIPKLEVADERYDVLGLILFVEEAARQINSKYNTESYIREIVITDQTHNQTLTISAWNDLSGTASDALNFWAEKFTIVGFTALKHNPRRAFALSTTMSTRIIHNPKGDRANMLREWVVAQKQLLQDRQARVLQISDSTQEPSMKTIEELKEKKAANSLMEERHWIQEIVPNASLDNVFVYTGCSQCGNKCRVPEGRQFTCIFCDNKNCVSAPRVAFKFEVVDVTGSMTLTSFNNDTEKMFGKTAAEVKTIKDCGDVFGFQEIEEKLRKKTTFFKLGPSNSLGSSSVLEWSLKTIETSDDVSKKDEAKLSVARNAESEYSDPNNSIVIADEGEHVVKDSTILRAEPIKTPKLSTTEWTYLCRTRMSGTKHSPVTPAPIGDTKSSLDYDKSTAAKKLRFITPEKTESKSDEVAEKDPEE